MEPGEEMINRARAGLKSLSDDWKQGKITDPAQFLEKYKALLAALFRAEHPELGEAGHD